MIEQRQIDFAWCMVDWRTFDPVRSKVDEFIPQTWADCSELDMLGVRYHAGPFEEFSRAIHATDVSFWSRL